MLATRTLRTAYQPWKSRANHTMSPHAKTASAAEPQVQYGTRLCETAEEHGCLDWDHQKGQRVKDGNNRCYRQVQLGIHTPLSVLSN